VRGVEIEIADDDRTLGLVSGVVAQVSPGYEMSV
jgi:hypothetical protein